MPETCAQRTLVKSPPELWAEISDAQTLARRLSAFGEVRITRMEPETAVAWEGALVRGTVELAASGWGTKVTIKAEPLATTVQAPAEPDPEPEPAPEPAPESAVAAAPSADPEATGTDIPPQDHRPAPREGFLARLAGWWNTGRWEAQRPAPAPEAPAETESVEIEPAEQAPEPPIAIEAPEVEPTVRAEPAAAPEAAGAPDAAELEGLLVAVLDDLGSAHHRPFSRA